jgi:YfiH family protein
LIELQKHIFAGHNLQLHENDHIILGFTEKGFPAALLQRFFQPLPLLFLKQIHSAGIVQERDWQPVSESDGLFLAKPGVVAVIQTADCLPLFYFADDFSVGGVIHVGWRGLCQGIEKNLLTMLPGNLDKYSFFLGPAIEKKCYPVGEELRQQFAAKDYRDKIFSPGPDGKYLMDIKGGLVLSLVDSGIHAERIQDCGLCTFCLPQRFPSYRRDGKTGKRIFNFLALR